jgi:glycine/D-amino acid oxidase-like deaminating enzyme
MDLTSGYPLWPIQDGLPASYPALDRDIRCDAVVLGGGITGAMVAHELVDAGFDTVVVDRREAAWGSTAASTGLLQYEIDVPLTDLMAMRGREQATRAYLACRDAIDKLEHLAHAVEADVGFERKKSLYLAVTPDDRDKLRAECELRRGIGIRVDYLSESEISARFSLRRPAALLSYDAAQVDTYAFAHALLRAGVRRGLHVFDRTAVVDIDTSGRNVSLTTANRCVIRARRLVLATGYETQDFLSEPVAKLASTYAVASEPLRSSEAWGEDECLIWERARPYLYLRTTPNHRVVVGGEDEPFRDPKRRDRLLAAKTKTLVARTNELLPDIEFEPAFAWTGTFGETEDGLPYIGAHPEWPNTDVALCYGGNGITYGALAAEIIRDSLCGRRNTDAELFRFDR